ncbi:MAG: hypothetical protein LBD23_10575 [Oscillospiraceae bacterium]|jgi:hypothetical protein|nr:hypothetical protein [Oscillospiraceae bacterium]
MEKLIISLVFMFLLSACGISENPASDDDLIKDYKEIFDELIIASLSGLEPILEPEEDRIENEENPGEDKPIIFPIAIEEEPLPPLEINTLMRNVVTDNPVMNQVTFEISEKLIGKYEAEEYSDMYFEIRADGTMRISLATVSGNIICTNENFYIVAFYIDDTPDKVGSTFISFRRILGDNHTFPGAYLSIDFSGNMECTHFKSKTYMSEEEITFIKVS